MALISLDDEPIPQGNLIDLDAPDEALEPEAAEPERGFLSSLGSEVWQGTKSAGRSVLATGNTAVGDLPDVESLAKSQNADRSNDAKEKKALLAEIERRKKLNPEAGWTDAVKDVAGAAWDNKTGTAQMVASQLPNSAVALGGAWAGGKAGAAAGAALGSVVPGVGTVIGGVAGGILGGLTGMFLGNFALETGGKAMEKAGDGFTQQEASDSLTEGAKKAAVITGVDAATFGAGRLATRAFVAPAVRAGARAEAKVLVDAGVDITNGASIAAALANTELRTAAKAAGEAAAKAASSATRRAGNAATGLTMETVGEGVGEYYGEEAATGNGDVYDAALESISSLSQSAFQTAQAMRESGVQGLDPKEILKVQLNESAAKPGSVLSRATVAANPELKIEPVVETPIQPTPIDPAMAQRLAEVAQGASFDGLPAGESSPLLNEIEDDGATNGIPPGDPVGAGLSPDQSAAGVGVEPGPMGEPGLNPERTPADAVVPPAGLSIDTAAPAVAPIAGDQINKTWTEFRPASGTLNIPRKEMPQVKSEHRGAMTNFLAARGVTGTAETVEASSLKPTQREFSPAKVKQALAFQGNDRPILVSSDGHILDGHHQWLAKAQQEAPVKITRLSAPIAELLTAMKEFPSAGMTKDAEPFSQPQGKTNEPQATQALEATQEGQEAPAAKLKLVLAPQNVAAEPVSPANPGNALVRLRRAQVQRMAKSGFTQLVNQDGQTLMVNPTRNEAMVITGGPVAVALAQRAIAAQAPAGDNVALGQTNGSTGTTGTGLDQGRAGAAGTGGEDGAGGIAPASARDGRGLAGGAAANPGQTDSGPAGVARVVAQNQTLVSDSGAKIANHQATLARQLAAETNPARRIALSAEIAALPKMGQPPADVLQSFAEMASNWAQTIGTEAPVAYWDDSPTASDGFEQFGRTHVNLSRPTMALQWTIAHESDHSQEKTASPQEEALRAELWNQVTPEGRKIFFEGFLYRGKKFAQATPAELMRLRSEMLAEFQGGRFTDAAWLEKLAQQKPGLFGRFVAEWIPTLTRTIAALKSRYAIGDTTSKKSVDKFMKDLEKAKDIAMQIAILWAEKNQGLAQKSGLIETAADVQYARRVGPKHSNLTDDYLVPESAIWQDSTGNLINLPPLTFKGLNRSYPGAPVRIRIGRHGDEANPMTGRPYGQYGLQHRVSNEAETPVKKYRVDGDKTDAQQWADLAVRDLMVGLMAGRSLYAQQDAAKLGVWSPDPGGQAGLWTILQYATDKETGEKFWDVQTVTPRSAKWVADNHRNNAPLPMSGFTFDGLDAQTSSGLAVRTLNELRAPTPIPPSAETVSIDDRGQVVNPRTAAPVVPVAQKPAVKVLARDANGKIILNKNKVQLSLRDELQAELDAEMNGVQVADINTIMAEEAYPPVAWREAEGSVGTQYVADIDGAKGQERLEMNEDSRSGLWELGFPGTWVGPAMGERDGYASKKAVQAFAQRQAAAYDLRAKGFDLAATLDKQKQYDLLDAWKTLERVPAEGSVNGAHKYAGIQAASQSLKDIANDMGITQDYDLTVVRDLPDPTTVLFSLAFKHKASGAEFGAMLEQHQEGGKRFLTANTLEMGKGGLGAAFYQLAAEYAARRNLPLRPESALSGINSYRRTEQQLSAALRTGKSNVMVPHRTQRVYGFEDNASRKESHDANIVRLILAGLRNAKELVKDFAKLRYVPETGEFTDAKGKNKEAAVQKLLADPDARAFGLGRSTLARALLSQQILDGAKAPESFKEPILYSARDTAAVEYQAVIDQYQGTDAWMKAPNGQPTKLTERQWVQVRTPSFAAWFGPWQEYGFGTEKGTVWNDDKGLVSKAIDENGEPLVVYHGTDKGGFMAFSQPGGERRGDLGIFTTPNRDMASSYVRKGREQDLTPPSTEADLVEMGYEFNTEGDEVWYTDLNGNDSIWFGSRDEAVQDALDNFEGTDPRSGVYAVFANIRNPNEDDFEGALWSGSREHLWQVVDADGETRESGGRIYMEEDEARALAKSIADPDDEYEGADFLQPANDHWNDTDSVVREAVSMKHDGAIIRNVIDDGGGRSSYDNEPSDVFVALKPEMVKSADFNTGEFGLSRDLRYSKRSAEEEDRIAIIPGARPGEFGWSFYAGDKEVAPFQVPTQNEPRLERIGPAAHKILQSKGVKDLARDAFGIQDFRVVPLHGSWMGKAEPSFALVGDGMTFAQADPFSKMIGFAWAQDAAIVLQPTSVETPGELPAIFIGNDARLSAATMKKVLLLAQQEGLDYSSTIDGKAVKFLHFGDNEGLDLLQKKVKRIQEAAGLKHAYVYHVRSALNEAEIYLDEGSGGGDVRAQWVQDGPAGPSDLFRRVVDHLLVPYAKAVAAEGYRFSVQRFANKFGLSDAQRDLIRQALLPRSGVLKSTVPIAAGQETLEITPTSKNGKVGVSDILWALQNRSAKQGLIEPGDYSDRALKLISEAMTDEVLHHIKKPSGGKSAIGWYDRALKAAKVKYHAIFPELATDKNAELLFDALWGITSQGNDVFSNSVYGARVYTLVRNGDRTIPQAVRLLHGSFGGETAAIEKNLLKLHELIDRNGYDRMRQVFNTKDSVSQINSFLRGEPSLFFGNKPLSVEGQASQIVTGWMVFGPKIGSFINNLHGDYSTLTADLWFSRTWNRILGYSFVHAPALEAKQYQNFMTALVAEHNHVNGYAGPAVRMRNGKPSKANHGNDAAELSDKQMDAAIADPYVALALATKLESNFRKSQYKVGSDLRRAAKVWIENRSNPVAIPRGDVERSFQQRAAEKTQQMIKRKTGMDITIADIQAALWFYEKDDLFGPLGGTNKKSEGADYSGAATELVKTYQNGKLFYAKVDDRYVYQGDYLEGKVQHSAREGGPGDRVRASDSTTVRAAIHFGQRAGLSSLSGLSNGTGIRGAEDQRLKEATDPRIKRRVYFYSPVAGGIPQPEAGLGGNVYQADLTGIYDPSTANTPVRGSGNALESALLDAGYDGYIDPSSGVIVMLGQDVPVKQIGSISDFKLIPRVAKQVKLKTQTTVSGDELSRKPEPAELSGLIKNKAAIAKAAPSFRFEYGYARVKQSESAAFDQVMSELGSSFRFTPEAVNLVTTDSLPNSKMTVNKTLAQRADTLRELIDCLA